MRSERALRLEALRWKIAEGISDLAAGRISRATADEVIAKARAKKAAR